MFISFASYDWSNAGAKSDRIWTMTSHDSTRKRDIWPRQNTKTYPCVKLAYVYQYSSYVISFMKCMCVCKSSIDSEQQILDYCSQVFCFPHISIYVHMYPCKVQRPAPNKGLGDYGIHSKFRNCNVLIGYYFAVPQISLWHLRWWEMPLRYKIMSFTAMQQYCCLARIFWLSCCEQVVRRRYHANSHWCGPCWQLTVSETRSILKIRILLWNLENIYMIWW